MRVFSFTNDWVGVESVRISFRSTESGRVITAGCPARSFLFWHNWDIIFVPNWIREYWRRLTGLEWKGKGSHSWYLWWALIIPCTECSHSSSFFASSAICTLFSVLPIVQDHHARNFSPMTLIIFLGSGLKARRAFASCVIYGNMCWDMKRRTCTFSIFIRIGCSGPSIFCGSNRWRAYQKLCHINLSPYAPSILRVILQYEGLEY